MRVQAPLVQVELQVRHLWWQRWDMRSFVRQTRVYRRRVEGNDGRTGRGSSIGIEQFLNSIPLEKRLWLVGKKPGSCAAAGELLDEFEQTRRSATEGRLPSEYPTSVKKAVQCAYCDKE